MQVFAYRVYVAAKDFHGSMDRSFDCESGTNEREGHCEVEGESTVNPTALLPLRLALWELSRCGTND